MNDSQFGLQFLIIAALAFVPPHNVVNSYDELCCVDIRSEYDGDADKVLDYFKDTYIGHFHRNVSWRPPLFPIELWNMFNRTTEELPRKNKNIEAWHNSFPANVLSIHPTFWKFLDVLLRAERIVQVAILQNQAGHAPEPHKNCQRLSKPVNYGLSTTHCS